MLPWWWSPQRMMSNSVPEREKETLTGCVSFYTQWIDICVCIRVRGLLWDTLIGDSCGTLLWDTLVRNSCGILL